ncbi:unnamed protein product [Cuscuta epithymum]|uniref:Uncharacterized protein n=1 Tax=Cuscuta epithymum TaxID=186058 RepID=A0AAV0DQS3_9ASTE|nr:unnamed protein product [Cuscuta epithymum]
MEFREIKGYLPLPPTGQEVIATLTITYSSQSTAKDISNGNVRPESIENLLKIDEDGRYWTFVDIVAFDNYKEWSYTSCKNCSRKVTPRDWFDRT